MESLTDDELLGKLVELLHQSRRIESELVAHIAEVDERRLYASEGSSSMFSYATEVLHLSEAEAYLRIALARAARRHPVLLEMLGDGRLQLSGIALLANHLTESDRDALLARAAHRSKRQIEEHIAELAPKPDVSPTIRKLATRSAEAPAPSGEQLLPDRVVRLLCFAHNAYLAEREYGKNVMRKYQRSNDRVSEPALVYFGAPSQIGVQLRPSLVPGFTFRSPSVPDAPAPRTSRRIPLRLRVSASLR